jgi:hypothetical protein
MALEPGPEEEPPAKVCHVHPLGCPDRRCKVCKLALTADWSGVCEDCQRVRVETVPTACDGCGKSGPIKAIVTGIPTRHYCADCAFRGRATRRVPR